MKIRIALLATFAVSGWLAAANIDRATITEVVNNVTVIEPATKKRSAARVQEQFFAPNVLRTEANSRAEMIAPDQTVTRIGQNTLFSFEPNSREIDLQRGSILFQSPTGKGGGTIRTPAASAAVLGTTLIVVTTANGGFKVLLIEGSGRVKSGGALRNLRSGEMVYALPGGKLSQVFEFRLSQQVAASRLVSGFKKSLPSAGKITAAVSKQEAEIAGGSALATNLLASGVPTIAYRVDVARGTQVVEETSGLSAFKRAIASDGVVTDGALDPERTFTPGGPNLAEFTGNSHPFLVREPAIQAAGPVQRASNPAFFVGDNITFAGSNVDLGAFGQRDLVMFLAIHDIHFGRSVDFGSFPGQLHLLAGRTFSAARGIVISADTPQFVLSALGSQFELDDFNGNLSESITLNTPLSLSNLTVENRTGSLQILGGDVRLQGVRLEAARTVRVAALRDLFSEPAGGGSHNFVTAGRSAILTADRDVRIRDAGVLAPRTFIHAGRSLLLSQVRLDDGGGGVTSSVGGGAGGGVASVGINPTVLLRAQNLVGLQRVNFLASDVLIQGRTVALDRVGFSEGSRVILESAMGRLAANPNTGASIKPGFVNFIRNVKYGSAPAQLSVKQNGAGPTPGGGGIFIRPRK